jgi:hypothetical protein
LTTTGDPDLATSGDFFMAMYICLFDRAGLAGGGAADRLTDCRVPRSPPPWPLELLAAKPFVSERLGSSNWESPALFLALAAWRLAWVRFSFMRRLFSAISALESRGPDPEGVIPFFRERPEPGCGFLVVLAISVLLDLSRRG